MNNTRHNAYNSLFSAEYVGFASLNVLVWSSQSVAGTPGHLLGLAHRTRFGVRQLLKTGMRNPEIIRNNRKNYWYNSEIIVK